MRRIATRYQVAYPGSGEPKLPNLREPINPGGGVDARMSEVNPVMAVY